MRLLIVTVPADREADVLECLQGEACQLKNVTRTSDGVCCTFNTYVDRQVANTVLHQLDLIGVGSAIGKVAMVPIMVVKPINVSKQDHLDFLVSRQTWYHRGRLSVEEMYANISEAGENTFDYLVLVIVAAWIAAVGLTTNSAVMIVASMLISPLMGPILMFCFGTSVQDWHLSRRGILLEIMGVGLTWLVGLIAGLFCSGWLSVPHYYQWPTNEMVSRGQYITFITGAFFAIPSGAGVAMCATMGGATAIVGVAIAASLLPPLVNSGMCLGFAIAGSHRDEDEFEDNDFYRIAWISFILYVLNVFCIYVVSLGIFYMKNVRPVRKQLSLFKDLPPAVAGGRPSKVVEKPKVEAPVSVARSNGPPGTIVVTLEEHTSVSIESMPKAAQVAATWRSKVRKVAEDPKTMEAAAALCQPSTLET